MAFNSPYFAAIKCYFFYKGYSSICSFLCIMFNKRRRCTAQAQIYKNMEEKILEQLSRIEKYSLLSAKNVLSLDDVSVLTGLSKSHLYKLTCSHRIPHYKPNGKLVYFDRGEIENWMKQNRIASEDEVEQGAINYCVIGKHV